MLCGAWRWVAVLLWFSSWSLLPGCLTGMALLCGWYVACVVGVVGGVCWGLAPCRWCACVRVGCWRGLVGVACPVGVCCWDVGLCGTVFPVLLGCPSRRAPSGVMWGLLTVLQRLVWGGPPSLPPGGPLALPAESSGRCVCGCGMLLPPAGVGPGAGGFVALERRLVLVCVCLVILCRPCRGFL